MDYHTSDSNKVPTDLKQRGSRTQSPAPPIPERVEVKARKHYNRGIEFEYQENDYSVPELYEKFQNDLPQTVIVTEGFCGEIIEDIFDRGQVLRIHAISKQRRVVAKFQYVSHSMLISIPDTYEEKLCLVKHRGKREKPKQIYAILKEKSLPLTVQFPKDQTITVGNQTISTNNIPSLELTQAFDEVYLLGNFINHGKMNMDVVPVPLYLSHLRLSVVTGIKGQSEEKWADFQLALDCGATGVEFDLEFGNPNIAEYDPNAIHSEGTYTYVEPKEYSNIISLVHKTPERSFDSVHFNPELYNDDDGPGLYEEIDNTARDDNKIQRKRADQSVSKTTPSRKDELEKAIEESKLRRHTAEAEVDVTPTVSSFKPQLRKSGTPASSAATPKAHNTISVSPQNAANLVKLAPPIPERKLIPKQHQHQQNQSSASSQYTNLLPRSLISPTVHVAEENKPKPNKEVKGARDVESCDDVTKLTIDEVSEYMRKLKLERYAQSFKEQLVDGRMLVALDKDMLKEEFGMKGIEALRLINFAKDGHLPK